MLGCRLGPGREVEHRCRCHRTVPRARIPHQRSRAPDRLARLGGQPAPFLRCGSRRPPVTQLAACLDLHPEHVGQEPETPVGPEPRHRSVEQVGTPDLVADGMGRQAQQPQGVGVPDGLEHDAREDLGRDRTAPHGLGDREGGDVTRSVSRPWTSSTTAATVDRASGPVSAHQHRSAAPSRRFNARSGSSAASASRATSQSSTTRAASPGTPSLKISRSKTILAPSRSDSGVPAAASRRRSTMSARPRPKACSAAASDRRPRTEGSVVELGRSLERPDGREDRASLERDGLAGLELVGDLVVRPDDRLGAVPRASVRLVGEDRCDGGVGRLAARHRLRPQDADRTSGCRKAGTGPVVAENTCRRCLVEPSTPTGWPASTVAAARISLSASPSSTAATRTASRVCGASRPPVPRRPARAGGSGASPRSPPTAPRRGGPPGGGQLDQGERVPERCRQDLLPADVPRSGACAAITLREAASSSGRRSRCGRPAERKGPSYPVRMVPATTRGVPATRRPRRPGPRGWVGRAIARRPQRRRPAAPPPARPRG